MGAERWRRLGAVCKRVGPGRLPRSDSRDIGAGYACGTAALLADCLVGLLLVVVAAGNPESAAVLWGVLALFAIPVVVPAAFLAGLVTWRYLPERGPIVGAVGGFVATGLAYLVGMAALTVAVFVGPLSWLSPTSSTAELTVVSFLIYWGVAYSAGVTFPTGVATGYVYERVRVATAD